MAPCYLVGGRFSALAWRVCGKLSHSFQSSNRYTTILRCSERRRSPRGRSPQKVAIALVQNAVVALARRCGRGSAPIASRGSSRARCPRSAHGVFGVCGRPARRLLASRIGATGDRPLCFWSTEGRACPCSWARGHGGAQRSRGRRRRARQRPRQAVRRPSHSYAACRSPGRWLDTRSRGAIVCFLPDGSRGGLFGLDTEKVHDSHSQRAVSSEPSLSDRKRMPGGGDLSGRKCCSDNRQRQMHLLL